MTRQAAAAALLALSLGTAQAQQADLVLTMSASPDPVTAGSELTYTLTVTNLGPDPALSVTVEDPLPEGSTFVGASPECAYDPLWHRVDCALPLVPPLAPFDFTVVVQAGLPPQGPTLGVYFSGETWVQWNPALFLLETGQAGRQAVAVGDPLLNPRGVATLPDGALLVAVQQNPDPLSGPGQPLFDGALVRVERGSGAQTVVTAGGLLVNPTGIAVAADGAVYVADPDAAADQERGRVLRVEPSTGEQTLVAELGLLVRPAGVAPEAEGTLLVTDLVGRLVRVFPGSGAQQLISEGGDLVGAEGVAVEAGGTAVVAVPWVGIVRVDLATGAQSLLAPVTGFEVLSPVDVAVAPNGDLYVADCYGFEVGAILHFDPVTGQLLTGFSGGEPTLDYRQPHGLELVDLVTNSAQVSAETPDPDPESNQAWAGVEVVEGSGPPPPVEIVVDEVLTAEDTVQVLPVLVLTVDESLATTDGVTVLPEVVLIVNELVAVSDQVAVLAAVLVTVVEPVAVTDQVIVAPVPPVQIAVLETVTVTDAVGLLPAVLVVVSEPVSVTDQVAAVPAVLLNVAEMVTVTDQMLVLSPLVIVVDELVLVTDAVTLELGDDEPPRVDWTGSVAAASGGRTTAAITQLLLLFSEPVADPPGDSEPDDVTNPANHLLLTDGGDGVFQTVDCAAGADPADQTVPVLEVLYLPDLRLAAVTLGNLPLPAAHYRLQVCGTTSIVDLAGNPLDGNGDGDGGDDLVLDFEVTADNLLSNPNFDVDLEGWSFDPPAGAQVEHDGADADGAPTSGSARLANLGAPVDLALDQCVTVPGEGWYRVGGRVRVDLLAAGEPAPRLELEWFGQPACEGPSTGAWQTRPPLPDQGQWLAVERLARAPEGVVSARLALAVTASSGEDHETRWDSASLFHDPTVLFADSFEDGTTAAWSATVP